MDYCLFVDVCLLMFCFWFFVLFTVWLVFVFVICFCSLLVGDVYCLCRLYGCSGFDLVGFVYLFVLWLVVWV